MKVALIGFGVVGQGFVEILRDKGDMLRQQHGFDGKVVAVSDKLKGSVYNPDGLDIDSLLTAVKDGGTLDAYPDGEGLVRGLDSLQTIRETNADAIVEVTYTDIKTGQPALDHCRDALATGKHIATTNKGPIALAYRELMAMADSKGLHIGFEGTVMSGTPALLLGMDALAGCTISEVRGIFNGTTNFILTQMEEGMSYSAALEEAQALGYAEADPTADVEGYDTLGKVLILANTVMGAELKAEQVSRQGITAITLADMKEAQANRQRYKLIGYAKRDGDEIIASVQPLALPIDNPLAGVSGATNAITYVTDLLGEVTLVGPGAGRAATGFALLLDLLAIHRKTQ